MLLDVMSPHKLTDIPLAGGYRVKYSGPQLLYPALDISHYYALTSCFGYPASDI